MMRSDARKNYDHILAVARTLLSGEGIDTPRDAATLAMRTGSSLKPPAQDDGPDA